MNFIADADYRRLPYYKYQALRPEVFQTGIFIDEKIEVVGTVFSEIPLLQLDTNGELWIGEGYAWNGPSGPTYDTPAGIHGSKPHDALYQLMRAENLGLEHRKAADEVLYQVVVADGMWRWRAAIWYRTVRMFGELHAKPRL